MPYTVKKLKSGRWGIFKAGKVVGSSSSKADAKASVRARLAAKHGAKLGRRR